MATFTISQLTAKPSTYTMVDSDVFVMTTGTTTPLLSTVKANLADIRTFYETAGNEIRGSAWSTTNANSSTWDSVYATYNSVSAHEIEATSQYRSNSAHEIGATSVFRSNSGEYESVYSTYNSLSSLYPRSGQTSVSAFPSSSSVLRWAHGRTNRPGYLHGIAVCATAEHGYSVGDEISLDSIFSEYGTTKRRDRPAAMLVTSSTYISAIFAMGNDDEGTSHVAHIIPNAGINGSPDETLTPGNWNVKISFAGGA